MNPESINPDLLNRIIAFEQGKLTKQEVIELFQNMLNSGLVWELQGSYGRLAMKMIDEGLLKLPERMIN